VLRRIVSGRERLLAAIGMALVAIAGIALWLSVWSGSDTPTIHRAAPHVRDPNAPSHSAYALLYRHAIVRTTRISVLRQWPSPPYQTFRSGTRTCYEWYDDPVALYSLCFRNGILVDKAIS
jgi:hypothetical protein